MTKKINTKFAKIIKYYNLINYNLIYENQSINRYKNKDLIFTENNKEDQLNKLKSYIGSIKNCKLKKSATNLVFSDGNPKSKIMIIGEGPGANEDKEGLPFVGRAGKLLDKMLLSIGLNRKNVYITNVEHLPISFSIHFPLALDITSWFPIIVFSAVLPSRSSILGLIISMCLVRYGRYLAISSSVGFLFSGGL